MVRAKLRKARKSMGLSQYDIAKEVGIDRASYANIELGKRNPSLDVAMKIAKIVNKRIEDIFLPSDVSKEHYNTDDQASQTA